MSNILSKILVLGVTAAGSITAANAQYINTTAQENPEYVKVIQGRVAKIVKPLNISDGAKQQQVSRVIEQQYFDLNRIDSIKQADLTRIKSSDLLDAVKKDSTAAITARAEASVATLHPQFISRLNDLLDEKGVTEVKDGLTYHVVDVTYRAYTDMLPNLTAEQKKQIKDWLIEAREHAMDAGSSKEKHAWFGKYKGRINNYLSKAGVDMKAAEEDWKKRREAAAAK